MLVPNGGWLPVMDIDRIASRVLLLDIDPTQMVHLIRRVERRAGLPCNELERREKARETLRTPYRRWLIRG